MPKKKEVKIEVEGKSEEPESHFVINDPEYGARFFVKAGENFLEVTKPGVKTVNIPKLRRYIAHDSDSFITYIKKYADPGKGIIFFNEGGLKMFFNEPCRSETVELPLKTSLELKTFLSVGGYKGIFDQKGIIKAFETFPEAVADYAKLIGNLERMKIQTTTDFESNVDPDNHVFFYQEKSGQQTGRLPRHLVLTIPYLDGGSKRQIQVDLEITKPKSAEEKPMFELCDPRWERTKRDAVQDEVNKIKKSLPEWTFIHGEPRE